ncbi:hypothetical protein A2866_03420 [Candidatus Roizmanbacteria bacterium RIFCSPHIGHO2_01_FULL_39_8]|uniref:Uncharacterized protein n=1 Tax=Candidatus Roizmanbacteria bacterium RIFCSPHIGHO2_01_FULL_39_8 TaxID=1802033 RepID=A0A1F7GTM9_9BACT|nr:MAG: hypothetical protein A2866_03420 [Candidatus Roizmanbacteria bacterium RIFCSPHIGHO2_01_FULL_39_8]
MYKIILKRVIQNESLSKFLTSAIGVIFVTNLWIISYTNILTYLSFLFPPVVNEHLLRNIAFPNPFKIPLYLFLTTFLVVGIWFLYSRFSFLATKRGQQTRELLKWLLFLFLFILFLRKLGPYPLSNDFFPYIPRSDPTMYTIIFGLYCFAIVFCIIQLCLIARIFQHLRFFYPLFSVVIILIVAFFTFEPRFPISGHDYSFFFGPILEIARGKTIYTDIPIQHGVLSILSFALLYKFQSFELLSLPAIVWFLYVVLYYVYFYLIHKISRSLGLALIGLFSIITLNYFSLSGLPASYPQIGPMRWLPLILVLFFLYRLKNVTSKRLIFAIALFSFWFVDSGIALLLSYLATLGISSLSRSISVKKTAASIIFLFMSLIAVIFGMNIVLHSTGYRGLDLFKIVHTLNKYASLGIAQLPIESHTYFWFVPLIYFASIIYFFTKHIKHADHVGDTKGGDPASAQIRRYSPPVEHLREGISGQNLHDIILLFSANLSLFASIYYLGRAHPHNLFIISIFPLLNVFILVGVYITESKPDLAKKIVLYSLLCITFIMYPAFSRKITLTEMLATKYTRFRAGRIFTREADEIISKRYKDEAKMINRAIQSDSAVVLSNDDTYLFYLIKKKNLLDADPLIGIDTQDDLKAALKKVTRLCPEKIAVDCSVYGKCDQSIGINQSGFFPASTILSEIQKKCRITYTPVECTSQLCIAQKK